MTNRGIILCGFFIAMCLVIGGIRTAGCSDRDAPSGQPDLYRPVAVDKYGDIVQLEALIENYTKAWKSYINSGDRDIFRYIKNAGQFSEQVILKVDNASVSYVSATVSEIQFADTGKKAFISVFGHIPKKSKDNNAHSYPSEYRWFCEAEIENNSWVLSKCTPNAAISDWTSYGKPRSIFINRTEWLSGDDVYFANPKDAGRLYRANTGGSDISKLLDVSVVLLASAYPKTILYMDKARNNEVWMFDSRKLTAKKAVMEFADKDGSYFTDGYSIFRIGDNGRSFQRIYSRVLGERSRLTMIDVKDKWVYFFFFSEGGKMTYRVKTDGAACEWLADAKSDWRDEDY